MYNSEFSESLSNALLLQLKDVFILYFFYFLFNIQPSTLVLADKTRRLFEVLSLFLALSPLFCFLGQRHNKLLDRFWIHSLSRLWAIRSRDVSKASWSLLQTFFMLRCIEANVYLLGGFPETARHHKVVPFEIHSDKITEPEHSSLFEQREHDFQVHFFEDFIVSHFALPFDIN